MDYLNKILSEENLDQITETFDEEILLNLDPINVEKIIEYLSKLPIDYLEDIVVYYTDLFSLDYEDFVEKFSKLQAKYGPKFLELLAYHLDILDSMWTI